MRQIKFRSWDTVHKRFEKRPIYLHEEGLPFVDTDPSGVDMSGTRRIAQTGERYVIEFFTGLKDKNGKEIFEGDILGLETFNGVVPAWIVRWNEDRCFWSTEQISSNKKRKISSQLSSKYFWIGHPVIGNIHEHPNLLKP